MSWLNIFGQKKEAVPPPAPGGGARRAAAGDPQEKLRRVQNDREARSADVESIQTKISYETGQYKKAMANNDQATAGMLKKRLALLITQRKRAEAALLKAEQMELGVKTALDNQSNFNAMRQGNADLKDLTTGVDVDEVEDIVGDVEEQLHEINEVGDMLARPITGPNVAEDDVDAYLASQGLETAPPVAAPAMGMMQPGMGMGMGMGMGGMMQPGMGMMQPGMGMMQPGMGGMMQPGMMQQPGMMGGGAGGMTPQMQMQMQMQQMQMMQMMQQNPAMMQMMMAQMQQQQQAMAPGMMGGGGGWGGGPAQPVQVPATFSGGVAIGAGAGAPAAAPVPVPAAVKPGGPVVSSLGME